MQNPYSPPGAPPPGYPQPAPYAPQMAIAPVIEGDRITISKFATWPACCVKCGAMAGLEPRVQKHAWVPPWTYALLPLGLLPAAIVQMALTKRATITHPVCSACNKRWTLANIAWRASILVPVFGGLVVFMIGASADSGVVMALGGLLFFPGILIFPILAHFLLVRPRTLRTLFIDDYVIKLAGVSPAALEWIARG